MFVFRLSGLTKSVCNTQSLDGELQWLNLNL